MAWIKIDFENTVERWWDAAREHASTMKDPIFTRVLRAIDGADEIEIARAEAEAFLAVAATLPGWNDGNRRAPRPVVVEPHGSRPAAFCGATIAEGGERVGRLSNVTIGGPRKRIL